MPCQDAKLNGASMRSDAAWQTCMIPGQGGEAESRSSFPQTDGFLRASAGAVNTAELTPAPRWRAGQKCMPGHRKSSYRAVQMVGFLGVPSQATTLLNTG